MLKQNHFIINIFIYIFKGIMLCVTLVTLLFLFANTSIFINSRPKSSLLEQKEFAIVLGASVKGDSLSEVLKARMNAAVQLYNQKLVSKILMSGDGTNPNYKETSAMKKFALKSNIPEEVLYTDEKGYSTYATLLRAKEIYNIKSAYIITQNFHLSRAVWIAREVGIDADGFSAGEAKDVLFYSLREFIAKTKDYFLVKFKFDPY